MNMREVRDAFGDWLSQYKWNSFATLTFKRTQSLDTAKKSFRNFIERIKKGASYFVVLEEAGNNLHLHALLGNMDDVKEDRVKEEWKSRHGIAQVNKYDAKLGARYYITKSINSDRIDWDFKLKNAKKAEKPIDSLVKSPLLEDL